ncbi:5590_t:CDS:2 [Scutellospora calospora]|uniref:5590_t:CDS:1 n=1 Tax=Scutellospora calospora TaxID=85575 RepID=A0ACA9K5J6_9GLOM|nr:5590_t:CDS:2 [Scutellospora calospora]
MNQLLRIRIQQIQDTVSIKPASTIAYYTPTERYKYQPDTK